MRTPLPCAHPHPSQTLSTTCSATNIAECLSYVSAIVDGAVLLFVLIPITALLYTRHADRFRVYALAVGIIVSAGLVVTGLPAVRRAEREKVVVRDGRSRGGVRRGWGLQLQESAQINPGVFVFCAFLYLQLPLTFEVAAAVGTQPGLTDA